VPVLSAPALLYPQVTAHLLSLRFLQQDLMHTIFFLLISSAMQYVQFELLMCFLAADIRKSNNFPPKVANAVPGSVISLSSNIEISSARAVSDFFSLIKISEPLNQMRSMPPKNAIEKPNTVISSKAIDYDSSDESLADADPQIPLVSSNCVDQYTGSLRHSRQAMLFRMQTLFEAVENILLEESLTGKGPSQALVGFVKNSRIEETVFSGRQRFASKPVVISDAIPMPVCPLPVEQLLHSALAHHNLGSFKETILFLDAAKTQFAELSGTLKENDVGLSMDFDMYVLLSKGNLYRSCGEDESAMICYMEGWETSRVQQTAEWDIIFVNSIGVLAYYLVRYDIALLCFDRVVRYREEVYGSDSSDTATALNNEGCSLFCMQERGEARLRFERCWLVGEYSLICCN
jgi:hypothetical protein